MISLAQRSKTKAYQKVCRFDSLIVDSSIAYFDKLVFGNVLIDYILILCKDIRQ